MKNTLCLLLFFMWASYTLANIDIQRGVWLVSPHITGSVWLTERCLKIENAAKEKQWRTAVKLANAAAKAEESRGVFLSNGEPLDLVLESLAAVYSLKDPETQRNAPVLLTAVLEKYREKAAGRRWFSYKYAQQALRRYYVKQNDIKNGLRLYEEVIMYDNLDKPQIEYLLSFREKHPEVTEEVREFILSLRSADKSLDPETTLNFVMKGGFSESEKIQLLEKWMEVNVNAFPNLAKTCLDAYLCVTNSSEKVKILDAIDNVKNYALRQRNDKSRMPVLIYAMRFIQSAEDFLGERRQIPDAFLEMKKEGWEWYENLSLKESDAIPWKNIIETSAYLWSPEQRQRETNALNLSDYVECFAEIEEFESRIADASDRLEDCEKYKGILAISGAAGRLYWQAESVFWQGDYEKAYTLMNFFLLPENSDGFTKGAAHFFLGRMLHEIHRFDFGFTEEDRSAVALSHLLSVHKYPTCLTYTSYAYIMAAELFRERGDYYSALTLSMADIPSIDFSMMEWKRHRNAALYAQIVRDKTNYVKNVQQALRYGGEKAEEDLKNSGIRWQCEETLWRYCQEHPLNEQDFNSVLAQAMEKEGSVFREEMYDAATHKWPKNFEIPLNIATNRVLNNNIFQRRQTE